jgi:excisionase family DNA binding protein
VAAVTTEELAEALGLSRSTALRWARIGVLPAPEIVHRGRRGRQTRWAAHTEAQARWVQRQLDAGQTFDEIAAGLAAGAFKPKK